MSEETYILKNKTKRKSQDYAFLRKTGLTYIRYLANELWTDYNTHDPGITIMEMLCYAITDLGYRARYEVEDILAEELGAQKDKTPHFFSARTIFPCHPVTKIDYRKLMIDVPGVKNAWLDLVDEPSPQVYIHCKKSELSLDPDPKLDHMLLDIRGLYDIILEFEEGDSGDLNDNTYLYTIKNKNTQFDIEVVLPSWDQFFNYPARIGIELNDQSFKKMNEAGLDQSVRNLLSPIKNIPFKNRESLIQDLKAKLGNKYYLHESNILKYACYVLHGISFGNIAFLQDKYTGTLKVKLDDNTYDSLEITVYSKGPETIQAQTLIQNYLNQTGTDSLLVTYQKRIEEALITASGVFKQDHANRNLCEDYDQFKSVETEEIVVCAGIEVTPDVDIEDVQAEIEYKIKAFLAPQVYFYTLKEMLARGKTSDQIFEGPILDHGFIDDEELILSEFREKLYVSDLIQIIMDVKGVVAVKDILVSNFFQGKALTTGEQWLVTLGGKRAMRLDRRRSKFIFYKELVPYLTHSDKVDEKLGDLEALDRHPRLVNEEYDLTIPEGMYKTIQRYASIQHDFPLCYSIGDEGVEPSSAPLRKAQVKQLKAFLLFYDQMLANFFAQLGHVKDLFSTNPKLQKTYFFQSLIHIPEMNGSDVPHVENLFKVFVDSLNLENNPNIEMDDPSTYETQWDSYVQTLKATLTNNKYLRESILEDQSTYEDRRNRFLDHLMARFCEQFNDYVMLMYTLEEKKAPQMLMYTLEEKKAPQTLIDDKITFIQDYPKISHDRGKGFDYKSTQGFWGTDNVSGLQKRVSRLLGFETYERRFLSYCIENGFEIYEKKDQDSIIEYRFRLKDTDSTILLSSIKKYYTKEEAVKEIQSVIQNGTNSNQYQNKTASGKYYFNLLNKSNQVIASGDLFNTAQKRDKAILQIINFLKKAPPCEGFYLIEHILLRPRKSSGEKLLKVCVDQSCSACRGFLDPYSFRVTVIIPCWPKRFEKMYFRRFVESTLRKEAPAHVHVKICWVDQSSLVEFEKAYVEWLDEVSKHEPNLNDLAPKQKALIEVLEKLNSVYTEATLHDCREDKNENPLLLNSSKLGIIENE